MGMLGLNYPVVKPMQGQPLTISRPWLLQIKGERLERCKYWCHSWSFNAGNEAVSQDIV